MIDELRARFLGRFLEIGRDRVRRALDAVAGGDPRAAWTELHALAGEAALIGLPEIAEIARVGGASARRLMDDGETASERASCDRALREIEGALAQLG
jgi:HPt (histidine-containing phosphotransfer) domain-containing protein